MFIGRGLSLEACRAAQAERRAANTATAAASVAAAAAAASTAAAAAAAPTKSASSASSPLITIMASTSPPKCPVLPDGRALMAAFVGMDKDRFSSMFADDVQVLCASGSDCKIHPGAGHVDESFHQCMNCALKFHSCITCSGVRFADWISAAAAREMLSQYGQEKFDHYKDDFPSSQLELCSYCQKSIALSIDVGRSCGAAVITITAVPATAAGDAMGTAGGDLLSSEEHYKKNHNLLKILMGMCHGLKNEEDSDIVIFDKDPWASMKVSTYHPSLLELKNEVKRRSKILIAIATKKGKQLSKKDNPSLGHWTMLNCQNWLETSAITDPSDVPFLCSEMQARLIVATKAMEQKQSEEQKLLQYDDGNN